MVRQQRQLVRALTRSGGQPLSDLVRRRMEPVVGLDLGPVRVHTDAEAQQATSALGARAATSGHSIVFGRGESPADQALLAHELVHVRQQAEGRTLTLRGLGGDLAARESLEAEAAGQRVVGQSAGTAERAAPSGEVVQAQMAGPEPRRYTITMTFPGLLPATATAVSADEALKLLRHFVTRLGGMIQVGMSALEDARKLREDQWVVGAVSDLLAWQSLPAPEIWDQAIALFSRAGDLIRARDVSRAAATVQQGISAYQAAYDAVTAYREGMSRGAGRAIVGLEVAEVAGAVAATVATGGLAGEGLLATAAVAGGTAGVYGAAQQTAGQVGEMQAGMRHEFDSTAIARRGATDAVTGLVGAFVGGALTRYAQRWFGSYLGTAAPELLEELGKLNKLPGPLPRDFFLTRGQRLLAEFLGGVGSTPLVTATRVVFERTLGTPGRWPTADEFTQQVVQEMAQGGAMQILMTFLLHRTAAGRARRREAAAPPAEPVRTRVRPAPAPPPARGSEPTQASARAAEPSAPAPLPESASTPARAPGPAAPGAARALEPPAPVPPSAGEAAAPEPTLAVEPAAPAPAASELEPAEAHSTKPPGPGHPGGPQARPAVTAESLLEMFTTLYRRPGPPKEAIRLHSSLDSFEAAYRAALPPERSHRRESPYRSASTTRRPD